MMQADLFRKEPRQSDLFAGSPKPTRASSKVNPDDVRAKMLFMLEQVRSARKMPWDERTARINEVIFPQMANWLPMEEADQLRLEFRQEFERLKSLQTA